MFKERKSHNHNLIILQLNCGWHGNDKHWKRGGNHQDYPYKGTPNNNLSEKIPFLWVVLPIHNEMFKLQRVWIITSIFSCQCEQGGQMGFAAWTIEQPIRTQQSGNILKIRLQQVRLKI